MSEASKSRRAALRDLALRNAEKDGTSSADHSAPGNRNPNSEHVTRIKKRSIKIQGHRTSISLEEVFWARLQLIAKRERLTVSKLVTSIDGERAAGNLSSAIRVFVLNDALKVGAGLLIGSGRE